MSSRPQPESASRKVGQLEQPVEAFTSSAERSSAVAIWLAERLGRCAIRSAAAAETCGAAKDVPWEWRKSAGPQSE